MKRLSALLLAIALATPALAQPTSAGDRAAQPAAALADGEVRKVDKDAKKITLRHGPIANLDMPPMTMVFQVKEAAMLDQVKAGDKVKFTAERIGGQFTVTRIQAGE